MSALYGKDSTLWHSSFVISLSTPEARLMTEEEKKKISEAIQKKWVHNTLLCDICNSKAWEMSDELVVPLTFKSGGVSVGGTAYPQVLITCTNCGNTRYFNAVVIGALKKEEKKEEPQKTTMEKMYGAKDAK
jgi:predicted nucleic-acid-binding Zn-ribbon protein